MVNGVVVGAAELISPQATPPQQQQLHHGIKGGSLPPPPPPPPLGNAATPNATGGVKVYDLGAMTNSTPNGTATASAAPVPLSPITPATSFLKATWPEPTKIFDATTYGAIANDGLDDSLGIQGVGGTRLIFVASSTLAVELEPFASIASWLKLNPLHQLSEGIKLETVASIARRAELKTFGAQDFAFTNAFPFQTCPIPPCRPSQQRQRLEAGRWHISQQVLHTCPLTNLSMCCMHGNACLSLRFVDFVHCSSGASRAKTSKPIVVVSNSRNGDRCSLWDVGWYACCGR
jgi:hypothetical protein